ncbi:clathrin adaptor complex small chain family protein [Cardiosporidium cionae]|uniref:AP complex subunit sigma n=1 Tax=Cardiosporidium cionae TaxID=476202 RepID=A0ABQ7JFL7_9APIC|nr:clathrin adaptor complex small chain family protein [Cardiosporidium cionae]|eukprot:KAF8822445.1 clathrin adaptor complex small chain family protein [Cardiosporidium cionae]
MLSFVLMVNRQGQTRLAQYYQALTVAEKAALENDLIRRCLSRTENECSILEHKQYKVIFRRYASLYFILGMENPNSNELSVLEFIHCIVEALDKYFENVCELDIMFNLEKAHIILDEMVVNGCIVETNKANILDFITQMDNLSLRN